MNEVPNKCKHETLEVVEEDGISVWMRCAVCFVLFQCSREEFEQLLEAKK